MTESKNQRTTSFLHGMALALCFLAALALPRISHAQTAPGAQVDVVFVMDTSGSMDDEFTALCAEIPRIVKELENRGVSVHYKILNIHPPLDANIVSCAEGYISETVAGATATHAEDWGPAVRDVSAGYGWQPKQVRVVITMSDEPPYHGEPCAGSDEDSIVQAITAALANRVRVAPILGSGHEKWPCARQLADKLATGTGGAVFLSTLPAADLVDGIMGIIGSMVADQDGDGITDKDDPFPLDPCKPDPQAVCHPRQVCGISNTPHWDDDGDGRTDEELPNGQDDDGDGLVDEDVGGPNCPFPPQDCGVNSHRGFDDDADGRMDEEIGNNKDDDGDGYIDEDVTCACPPPQTLATATKGVDDDHDFRIDEELPNGNDDDGDGCIDEDVGSGGSITTVAPPALPVVSGRITDGNKNPIAGAMVGILAGTDDLTTNAPALISTLTDLDGNYEIKVPWNPTTDAGKTYRVRVSLVHYDNGGQAGTPANQIFAVAFSPDPASTQAVFVVLLPFTLSSAQDKIKQSADFGELTNPPLGSYANLPLDRWDALPDLAGVYVRIYQAYRFARDGLGGLGLPPFTQSLLVRAFVEDSDLASADFIHTATGAQIRIKPDESRWDCIYAPKNVEWHEFGHHVMYLGYGGLPQRPKGLSWDDPSYDAHDGYINPDTTGSFVEGWATFYASAIALSRNEKNASVYPPVIRSSGLQKVYYEATDYLAKPDLEPNYRLWEDARNWAQRHRQFKNREEFAVAGILWDLLDPGVETRAVEWLGVKGYDSVSISARDLWAAITGFKRGDGRQRVSTVRDLYLAIRNNSQLLAVANASATDIEQIFYEHGAYIDPDSYSNALSPDLFGYSGGRYPHENYPNRPDVPGLPGTAVKINTQSLFGAPIQGVTLTVTTKYPPPFQVYDTEHQVYMAGAEGIFYYEPPPAVYTTTTSIVARAQDGTTSQPWIIDNQHFWQKWYDKSGSANPQAPTYLLDHRFVFVPGGLGAGATSAGGALAVTLVVLLAGGGLAGWALLHRRPAPALLWIRHGASGREFPLHRPELTIGRGPDNSLVLPGDLISRHHVRIRRTGDEYVIEDLGSTTGTFVNHQRVTRAVLHDGDEIGIGETLMVFRQRG